MVGTPQVRKSRRCHRAPKQSSLARGVNNNFTSAVTRNPISTPRTARDLLRTYMIRTHVPLYSPSRECTYTCFSLPESVGEQHLFRLHPHYSSSSWSSLAPSRSAYGTAHSPRRTHLRCCPVAVAAAAAALGDRPRAQKTS